MAKEITRNRCLDPWEVRERLLVHQPEDPWPKDPWEARERLLVYQPEDPWEVRERLFRCFRGLGDVLLLHGCTVVLCQGMLPLML